MSLSTNCGRWSADMSISWSELVDLYRCTKFDAEAGTGRLKIATLKIAETIERIENDDTLYEDAQISLVQEGVALTVGTTVDIEWKPPSQKLGLLVRNFDALFKHFDAASAEPKHYYVIEAAFANGDSVVPSKIVEYRAMLGVTKYLRQAASYVDDTRRELVFIGTQKIIVPARFGAADLQSNVSELSARLDGLLSQTLHADHRMTLFVNAICELAGPVPEAQRFGYLLRNLEVLCNRLEQGYKLFISSFSYSKIRNEVETARVDFVAKIHKTIVDIQNQLLGIPVATMIVAAQLKKSTGCSAEFWSNIAVLSGAAIFVALLLLAVLNQRKTLGVLALEIEGQKTRLADEYADVADQFTDIFTDLEARIRWHEIALRCVIGIGVFGFIVALFVFLGLTEEGSGTCLNLWR
jgi:hypothetical protein